MLCIRCLIFSLCEKHCRPFLSQCVAGVLGEGKMLYGSVDSSGSSFTPLVVLELASDTKEEAIAWLLGRIRDRQQNGGVEVSWPT